MAVFGCTVCRFEYDEKVETTRFEALPPDWVCPVCGAPRDRYRLFASHSDERNDSPLPATTDGAEPPPPRRESDELEIWMNDIREMAATGRAPEEAMRTRLPVISWDEILLLGAQLARQPLLEEEPVSTRTVIGPAARRPLVLEHPLLITHMSFGALSREAKTALAKGSAAAGCGMSSGEGGILEESISNARGYIFEYVPNRYSVTPENLRRADAIEIKFGQSAKPGMGGHLPGHKVTPEIAAVRGFPPGTDILSPARFPDIRTPADLKYKIDELRELSEGRPIGVKLAAGHIEEDLDFALAGGPDFITVDGRPGGTGSAPKYTKLAMGIPTIFALSRARKHLDRRGAENVSLIITGGFRIPPDFIKALAMGADAVAIGTAALIALGCQQFRMCNRGTCPMGIASQDPARRQMFDPDAAAQRLAHFLQASTAEMRRFARMTGKNDIHKLGIEDLCTCNSEISNYTDIRHA